MSSDIEQQLQTLLAKIAATRGFNAVEGLILSYLLLYPLPLTQREIADSINRSQSTVSRALKRMTKRGIVQWKRRSGSREMVYSAISESPQELILSWITGWIKTNRLLRNELVSIIKEQDSNNNVRIKRIVRDMIDTIDYVEKLMAPVIISLDRQNSNKDNHIEVDR